MAPRDGCPGSNGRDAEGPASAPSTPARVILDQLLRQCSPALTRHHARVGRMSERLALRLGLDDGAAGAVGEAGRLHDIGMALIPPEIINRQGPLDPGEKALIRRHIHWGHEILTLTGDPKLRVAARVAREHHERWDGSGYPCGLKGPAISQAARIVAVCAVYDAVRRKVAYREALDRDGALAVLSATGDTGVPRFDPEVVAAFQTLIEDTDILFDSEEPLWTI